LFDPREFNPDGYVIIADIPLNEARTLYRLFHYLDPSNAKNQYEQISLEVRERFEKHFKVDFT
jgi:hypothetical protein